MTVVIEHRAVDDVTVTEMRIALLRQERGWTQEKLAAESGVGVRTVQRMEAGSDASLETLALVADALGLPVRDLFVATEDELEPRVRSLDARRAEQQAGRDRVTSAWRWLYIGIGVTVTLFCFVIPQYSTAIFVAYWSGGLLIFLAVRKLVLEPRLDARFPLSTARRGGGRRTPDPTGRTSAGA